MAIGSPVLYADFSGGINLEAGPYLVSESECQDARNVTATNLGSIEKRKGSTVLSDLKISSSNVFSTAPHSLAASNTGTPKLLAVGPYTGGSVDKDAIVSVSTAGTTTVLKDDVRRNTRWEFAQGPEGNQSLPSLSPTPYVGTDEGPVYGINGHDTPQYWDGTSNSLAEWTAYDLETTAITPHPAKDSTILVYHLDKMWAAGDPNFPGRIRSSGININTELPDPCVWDPDYTDDVEPFDGQIITGLGKVGPYLLVFKNRKTYVLTNPKNPDYRSVSSSVGCCSHRSIVETTQGTFFLSEDLGVCVTDGSSISTVSDKIQPLLQEIANSQPAALKKAAACYFEDSYYLSVPYNGGTNTVTLEYSLATQSWWIHTLTSNQYTVLDPQGTPRLYSANAQSREINRLFVPNVYYDGTPSTPYISYWQGPYWAWGQPHLNKRINQLRIDGKGTWNISLAETFGDDYEKAEGIEWEQAQVSTTKWGDPASSDLFGDVSTPGGSPITGRLFAPQPGITQQRYYTPVEGWGRAWSLRITDGTTPQTTEVASNSQDLKIYSVAAFTRPRTD
jgi:hypothetical protein